jgi:hypothetical protein
LQAKSLSSERSEIDSLDWSWIVGHPEVGPQRGKPDGGTNRNEVGKRCACRDSLEDDFMIRANL